MTKDSGHHNVKVTRHRDGAMSLLVDWGGFRCVIDDGVVKEWRTPRPTEKVPDGYNPNTEKQGCCDPPQEK